MNKIINLHCHSHFSILDSLSTPSQIVEKTRHNELPAVAITDHGNCNNYGHFYLEAKEKEIKPILGIESYFIPSLKKWKIKKEELESSDLKAGEKKEQLKEISKRYHLILLVKNLKGFENLNLLIHESYKNFYYRPRIDRKLLEKYSNGLICSSACIAGEIQQAILKNKSMKYIDKLIGFYKEVFKDDFYLELQINEMQDQKIVNDVLIQLGKKYKIKTILTGDSHYTNLEDQKTHQTLLLMNSKSTYKDLENKQIGDMNTGAWEFDTKRLFLKNYEEYNEDRKKFNPEISQKKFDELCENTFEINEKIENYEINCDVKLKDINPEIKDKKIELENICFKKLKKLKLNENKTYTDRLKLEIKTITDKNLENYFFVVKSIIDHSKNKMGMIVGPSRGSAAGSLVCYLMEITQIDPLKYGLFFERFLARKDYPDIDIDFEDNDKIKEWILNTYQNESACISSYSTFHIFGLLKDLGRTYEIEDAQYWNNQTKMIRKELEFKEDININDLSYDDVINHSESFLKLMKNKDLKRDMKILMGKYRHIGRHAAGLIISKDLIKNQPIMIIKNQNQTSLTEGMQDQTLSKFGFIKIDVLGLKTLKVIHETVKLIEKRQGIKKEQTLLKIHPDKIDLENKEVFKYIFQEKNICGIFQFDTPSSIQAIDKIDPTNFNDLVAINALNRPGPKQFIDSYANRKKGIEEVKYIDKRVKPILKDTMGIMCVEENSMISLSSGYHKKIKDVNVGEFIKTLNENNNIIEDNVVINKFYKKDKGYKLILENGFNIIVTKDHKVFTNNGMKELQFLNIDKDFICIANQYNHIFQNIQIESWLGTNKNVSYLIGYMLGNGCLTGSSINICTGTNKQHKIIFKFLKDNFDKLKIKEYFHCRSNYITLSSIELLNDENYGNRKTKFHKIIEDLGLKKTSKNKRIPEIIFYCDSETQLSLICGIIDSDGTLCKTERGKEYYSICSTSSFLLQDVRQILLLNGINCRIGKEENRIYFSDISKFKTKIKKHHNYKINKIYEGVFDKQFLIDFKNKLNLSERGFEKKFKIRRQLFRSKNNFINYNIIKNILDLKDVRFYRIKKIEYVGYCTFYDLSVDVNHNYLANGIFVSNCYQEQIMKIAQMLAGYTLEDANILRKAMGKKIKELMLEQKKKFIPGCIKNGMEEKKAKRLFSQIKEFASYSFNLAHSVGYSMISYQCAYLKTFYSLEFYTALLRVEEKEEKINKIIKEIIRNKIEIKSLDISKSQKNFEIIDNKIYYGFLNIKGIGEKAADNIIEARKKKDIKNLKGFILNEYINKRVCNKRIVEILINSFVFGRNIEDKLEFFKMLQEVKSKKIDEEKYEEVKKSFLYLRDAKELKIDYLDDDSKAKLEQKLYGTNLKFSFFGINEREKKQQKLFKLGRAGTFKDNFDYFIVCFKDVSIRKDKNNNNMAFLDIEDAQGEIRQAIIFSSNLTEEIQKNNIYVIKGSNEDKFLIDYYKKLDDLLNK